jgi:hypothetical protein
MDYPSIHDDDAAQPFGSLPQSSVTWRNKSQRAGEKWPLWWTVIGVTTFCTLFWTAVFFWLL